MAAKHRDPLLTPREVSEWTGIPEQTLQNQRSQRRGIPFIKLASNRVKYRQSAVEAYLDSRTVTTS